MARPKTAPLDLPPGFRESESLAQTRLNGKPVGYTLKRSRRRRSITLIIDERGLRVGAPWRASAGAIEALLRKHDAWILKKLTEWEKHRPPHRRWQDGETLMLLGQPLRLTLAPEPREIRLDGSRFIVSSAWTQNADEMKNKVTDWLRQQALQYFRERIAHFHPQLEISEPTVHLSNARTRWGSCHINGRIHLNWRLIQMPPRLVDYVVVHELAHLVEMNHSPRFWKTVARIVPDYKACRTEIRTEGRRYMLV